MADTVAKAGRTTIARSEALTLVYPKCEKGIGDVIQAPDAPKRIEGVQVQPFPLWPDDRGYFLEIARLGRDLVAAFAGAGTQVSAALSYSGTIKAFHYHLRQTDYWAVAAGMLQIALVDLRDDSSTFGARNTFYLGALRPWRLLIPPGVGHGYKVIGRDPALLVYLTDHCYDPADEGRLAYNDSRINYDWETQHK